ncbi:MAG: hypothetical protein AAGU10_04740 [Methanosarcina mazei]|uniref:Uncharacterized protein n=1 Tax=Methanosarcina mazei TaxID=2209 RepID=A0A0F8MPE3_METMZ|nr:hypothetical protein [Methanosarcina mazei]KKG84946.1 hypothetical protein DU57_01740 [Methanosarcina mazei]KKG87601.1 hypothetical protein DU59_04160 [Methanosarcina mazei]KKH14024.1 hypothetical protein DU42_03110 [Methanosarcina mazei]NLO29385.1 hypothetical protein [Methanosarcina mazei]
MTEDPKKSRSLIPLYIIIILYYVIVALQGGGDSVLSEPVSKESDFQVNLARGVNYQLRIEGPGGPEKIDVTIRNGSDVAFQNTFVLTDSKISYLPYHPEFTVKENGTYHVHVKPLNSGTIILEIKKS